MNVERALAQVDAIWTHVARQVTFRGYRPITVGATGLMGLSAAAIQPFWAPSPLADIDAYLWLWVGVAAVSVVIMCLDVSLVAWREGTRSGRGLTVKALEQFVPCLVVGAVLTWGLVDFEPQHWELLPALWALCFSLGIYASRPYMSPLIHWGAGYYLIAGVVCLLVGRGDWALHPWLMGATFGIGQLVSAVILYAARRTPHEPN